MLDRSKGEFFFPMRWIVVLVGQGAPAQGDLSFDGLRSPGPTPWMLNFGESSHIGLSSRTCP
jgi:hypothetical protein